MDHVFVLSFGSEFLVGLVLFFLLDLFEAFAALTLLVDGLFGELALGVFGDVLHGVEVELLGLRLESVLLRVVQTKLLILEQVARAKEHSQTYDAAGEEEERRDFGPVDDLLELRCVRFNRVGQMRSLTAIRSRAALTLSPLARDWSSSRARVVDSKRLPDAVLRGARNRLARIAVAVDGVKRDRMSLRCSRKDGAGGRVKGDDCGKTGAGLDGRASPRQPPRL